MLAIDPAPWLIIVIEIILIIFSNSPHETPSLFHDTQEHPCPPKKQKPHHTNPPLKPDACYANPATRRARLRLGQTSKIRRRRNQNPNKISQTPRPKPNPNHPPSSNQKKLKPITPSKISPIISTQKSKTAGPPMSKSKIRRRRGGFTHPFLILSILNILNKTRSIKPIN